MTGDESSGGGLGVAVVRIVLAVTAGGSLGAVGYVVFPDPLPGVLAGLATAAGFFLLVPLLLAPAQVARDATERRTAGIDPIPAGVALTGSAPLVFVGMFVSGSVALAAALGLLGAVSGYRLFAAAIPEEMPDADG
ncbi:hypothetical protein SAMN05216388_1001387 [Halorientalis persicus]|jgi:hypothetical protein|uniref:Uncharacterized protein n=1 Tax=Halorientalis persicus TaxID=1367881 RepID=A0A1H8DUM1_9EURY|nr:hypothetical protein [Halorientalis persicus]SEN10846.1 hypothetical protein SAMN05216388_1001387 [Halorientalis persicus]